MVSRWTPQAANIELTMPHTHWPQRLVPIMSADIRGHEALHHHHHDGFAAANLLVWQLHESDVRLETDTFQLQLQATFQIN